MIYHSEPINAVMNELETDTELGLESSDIPLLLIEHGENKLNEKKKKTTLQRFLDQFKDVMILILIAAAIISFVIACVEGNPKEFFEPALILLIVIMNAIMGVMQESKAEKALDALKNLSAPHARVIRDGKETVIDAYCGTGTISLYLAQKARKVYGVEIVSPAIKDAEKNARENNVRNAEFIVGDCTKVMPRLYKQGVRPDVVVVDPPRAGCTQQVLETFANMQPQRIVYVSCNPATLARDIEILAGLGYKAEKVQPVDMFSASSHVENVCLLKQNSF